MSLAHLCRRASCLGLRLLRLDGRLPIERDGELVDNGVDENEIELVQARRRFELKSAEDRAVVDDEWKQDEARRVLRLEPHVVAERTGKRSSRDSVQVNAGTYEVGVRAARMGFGRPQPLLALGVRLPDDGPRRAGTLQDEDHAAQGKRLPHDADDRRDRLLDVFEGREQLADLVELAEAKIRPRLRFRSWGRRSFPGSRTPALLSTLGAHRPLHVLLPRSTFARVGVASSMRSAIRIPPFAMSK